MGALDSVAGRSATTVSWVLVALLVLAIPENVVYGDPVWTVFLLADLAVLVLPAAVYRDRSMVLPPAVTALAVLPGITRAVGPAWATGYVLYLGVAAVALAVVVEVTLFTETEMDPWFADVMVLLSTMAAIGVWAILQFHADRYLGTELIGSHAAVMWEFVRATVAGVAAAVVFELYFQYRAPADTVSVDLPGGDGA